jgi:hypothetical protein
MGSRLDRRDRYRKGLCNSIDGADTVVSTRTHSASRRSMRSSRKRNWLRPSQVAALTPFGCAQDLAQRGALAGRYAQVRKKAVAF